MKDNSHQYLNQYVSLNNGNIVYIDDFDGEYYSGEDNNGDFHEFKEKDIHAVCEQF